MEKPRPNTEEEDAGDSGVDQAYIDDAAKGAADLTPGDFSALKGAKIPTEADDGEEVTLMVTGTAKDGFLVDPMGAECACSDHGEDMQDAGKKGRIRIMIDGGDQKEEAQ